VNLVLGPGHVDAAYLLLSGASWLLMQQEVPDAANLAGARAARQHGVKTILNAAPSRPFPDAMRGLIDILAVNEIEAEAMGAPAIVSLVAAGEAATALLRFADATVVTAGAAGAVLATRSGRYAAIAGHAVDLVSTHGAGDCFIGTLAAQLAAGADLEAAAGYANATAALRVSALAGSRRFHDPAAVRALLAGPRLPAAWPIHGKK
jgi:ribokinase